jgi:alkanesulfonate monooxygenase SsuD/methylene tetrahydromethanopterin reductase-like flavin-dependent oxidoreductase (luciferase family)/FAD/FMN-containing dehydrogenase
MPDYGSPLRFGTFITPTNRPPESAVALAQLSEKLGYDLVTFQDHPYQPAFLDTWTLMTWVAARTSTIHIAPNVLNTPLRLPAVTARSAASLDLLSGGRFELGVGSGAFWDAVEAMGGRRLTPGQAVDALGEAIDIIRGIWADSDRTPLRVGGEFYRVTGAKRGPAPAHDMPIWIGAYKPRMLRLTGRTGDGWLPSLGYLQPGDLAAGNTIIDEAAVAAGRDPREIRRLLNISGQFSPASSGRLAGPVSQWVDELLPYLLEDGVGTLILGSDDPATLQRFAEEVAPALRVAVDSERGVRGTVEATVRPTAVRAQRREGIDYDAIPPALAAHAVEPGDAQYSRVRSTYMRGGSPGLVLRAQSREEVAEALGFVRAQNVALSVRSGGHGISGRSTNDGGIILDVAALNTIEVVDETARLVRVGPGARWGDVAAVLEPYGWALSSGDYGGVGVGGLATAGGIGWLAREHGLTIDHLVSAEVVLADGSIVTASATENPDLFWAVRGAGANFGIVTSFVFEVDAVGDVGWAQLVFDASDTAEFLAGWGQVVEDSPRDTTSFLIMGAPRRDQPQVAQVMAVVDSDSPETIIERLQPFADLAPLLDQSVSIRSYAAIMANAQGGDHNGRGEPVARSGLIGHITPEFARAVEELLASGEVHWFQIRSVGGAVNDVDPAATAYANRSANFSIVAMGSRPERLDALWTNIRGHFEGLYLSFETTLHPDRITDAFPPATIARLRELKRQYDPTNVFRDNFNITAGSEPAEQVFG